MLPLQIYTLNTLSMSHLDDRCNGGLMVGKFNQPLTNNRRKIKVKHGGELKQKMFITFQTRKLSAQKELPLSLLIFVF